MANIVSTSGIAGWSTTEASNQPDSADSATIHGDLRAIQSAVRYLYSSDTIASATTCDLGSKAAENLTVSGVTTITSFGSTGVAGQLKNVYFSGALTLTHNGTSLILPTGANITTVAGDTAVFLCEGSGNWRCLSYSGKSGQFFSGNFTDTTDSSSSTTGALKTAGGLGVAKNLYVGDSVNITGNVTQTRTTADIQNSLSTSAGQNRMILYKTGGVSRWNLYVDNSAESGSNAGSNFNLLSYTDAGSANILALSANRATGVVSLFGSSSNTAASAGSLAIRGGQIGFPAAQVPSSDANTLDDYSESTWTPTVSGITFTGANSSTYTYTKIGRVVYVNICLIAATSVSIAMTASITLPASLTPAFDRGFSGIANCANTGVTASYTYLIGTGIYFTSAGTSITGAAERAFISLHYMV